MPRGKLFKQENENNFDRKQKKYGKNGKYFWDCTIWISFCRLPTMKRITGIV